MRSDDFAPLKARLQHLRYLLVAQPAWYRDADNAIWLDAPWARDLLRHLDYISDLTVLAPMLPIADGPPAGWQRLPDTPRLRFRALPAATSARAGLLQLPAMFKAGWQAVRGADLVHSGAAGWPIPPGFIINPLAVMFRKPLVIVVESAFWRGDGRPRGRLARIMGAATERLARWSVASARLSVFTHQGYADELAKGARGKVLVAPASWIDESDILSDEAAQAAWAAKPVAPRFLLAARLIEAKGITLALQAMEQAEAQRLPITLDIIGEGPLAAQVQALADRLQVARLRLLAPVPYGPDFFAVLRGYHAVLVPSVSDEQPRILYDAFGQAVPALASDTPGHRTAVQPGETGLRFAPNNPGALLRAMAGVDADGLRALGLSARDSVLAHTHRAMHLTRARALAEALAQDGRATASTRA